MGLTNLFGIPSLIGKIRNLVGLNKAYRRGEKEGRRIMADKPMMKSKTFWGVLLTQIGPIVGAVGDVMQGVITPEELLTKAVTVIGIILAAYGARKAIGNAAGNGKPKV